MQTQIHIQFPEYHIWLPKQVKKMITGGKDQKKDRRDHI